MDIQKQPNEEIGEMTDLVVKEVSFVGKPAVPLATFVIVKELDGPEEGDGDDSGEIDVLLKKEEIVKEPVVQNNEMVTPTVSEETKAEVQACMKELVAKANSGEVKKSAKALLGKVASYLGVEPPVNGEDGEEEDDEAAEDAAVDARITQMMDMVQKMATIVSALQPQQASPAPATQTQKEALEDIPAEKNEPEATQEELVVTKEEPIKDDLLTRVAKILHKQSEQSQLQSYSRILDKFESKMAAITDKVDNTVRSALKALGRSPDDLD